MTDLATAVTAAAEAMRQRSTHTVETRAETLPQQAVDLILKMAEEINSLKLALAGIEQRVSAVERVEIVDGVNIRGAA